MTRYRGPRRACFPWATAAAASSSPAFPSTSLREHTQAERILIIVAAVASQQKQAEQISGEGHEAYGGRFTPGLGPSPWRV